jgi:hypothetical protein
MGTAAGVQVSLYAMPGAAALVQAIRLDNRTSAPVEATIILRGAARPGEEVGSFYDGVNGTVGRHRQPNPVDCQITAARSGITMANAAAAVYVRVDGNGRFGPPSTAVRDEALHQGPEPMVRPTVQFELAYRITLRPKARTEHRVAISFANQPFSGAKARPPTAGSARRAWAGRLASVNAIETPDRLLTMALRRSAAYSLALAYEVPTRGDLTFHSDHLEWPVDCARDCYHIANSLLLIEPELVRKHLQFYFLEAIPKAGPGKSYIGRGISCGEREARLLDLASYPLHELCRYWRATGDAAFVAQPRVRATIERMVDEVATWRSPVTGLYHSTERSSDERCVHPGFIPGNMLWVATLERLAELYAEVYRDPAGQARVCGLAGAGRNAIRRHAVVRDPEFGELFAFEVADDGQYLLYDHADIPNLLSATRFGFCAPDDPVYRNTLRFIYSARNQGYRGTMDGRYAGLCDGSKTMPYSPWPLGAMGRLMSGVPTPEEARRLLDWLRECLTPCFQLPEISDKHTGQPVQRYWFGWPTAMLLQVYIETICGVKIGKEIRFEPLVPAGWERYASPVLTLRGRRCQVVVADGKPQRIEL